MNNRRKFTAISLFVGYNCSLRCKYCFIDEKKIGAATLERLTEILDWFMNDDISLDDVHVHVFGTEPLFNWDLTKHVIDTVRAGRYSHKKQVGLGITTNGVGLTREIADYLKENDVFILCSVDGTKEQHNKWRVFPDGTGSWDIVSKNFSYWCYECEPCAEAAMTVTPDSIPYLLDNIMAIYKMGFDSIALNRVTDGPASPYTHENLEKLEKMLDYVIKYIVSLAKRETYKYLTFLTTPVFSRATGQRNKSESYACGAGKGGVAADIDGNIFICHRAIYWDLFKIGDIENGLDWERLEWWRAQKNKFCGACVLPGCSPCWVANLERSGSIYGTPLDMCRYSQIMEEKSWDFEKALKNAGAYDGYIESMKIRKEYDLNDPVNIRRKRMDL